MEDLQLEIPSDPARIKPTRKVVEHFAHAAGFNTAAVDEVGLLVNEALANVIRHAYQGQTDRPIRIVVHCKDGTLKITIRDWGSGVDPQAAARTERPADKPGGLGMVCLRKLADDIQFSRQTDGMLLTITKKLQTRQNHGYHGCNNDSK